MDKISSFLDQRLTMPMQFNGKKEHRDREVNSAEYFNYNI